MGPLSWLAAASQRLHTYFEHRCSRQSRQRRVLPVGRPCRPGRQRLPAVAPRSPSRQFPSRYRVLRLHPAEVADDRWWLLGQLLEDDPLEPGGGARVEPTGQGQDHAFLLAGPLDSHREPSISAWLKAKDLTM